jgi:ribonuclease BN (tRNA processing enzyme)
MEITILGASAAYPGPGEACSGFMVESQGIRLLVDLGTGVLSCLQKFCRLDEISGVVITHLHPDHFLDLLPLRYALRYGLDTGPQPKPRLYLPPCSGRELNKMVAFFAESDSFFDDVFNVIEFNSGNRLLLGDLKLEFVPVKHYIPTWAIMVTDAKKLAYSADSRMCDELIEIARNADLFICNLGDDHRENNIDDGGHLKPEQAGMIARQAGARRLLLSHLWPGCDRASVLKKAGAAYNGSVELASPGLRITL